MPEIREKLGPDATRASLSDGAYRLKSALEKGFSIEAVADLLPAAASRTEAREGSDLKERLERLMAGKP